jgi:aryl-alcohol dehydrogenase-like predicted oxidoreductase
VEAQWAAQRLAATPFISLQPYYSLLTRDIEWDVLPTAARHGLGVIVWSPLSGGMLTGKYTREAEPQGARLESAKGDAWEAFRGLLFTEENFRIVDAVGEVAAKLGTTHATVAVAWVLSRRGVTSAIIGPRRIEQLEDNLAAADLEIPPEDLKALDRASRKHALYPNFMHRRD